MKMLSMKCVLIVVFLLLCFSELVVKAQTTPQQVRTQDLHIWYSIFHFSYTYLLLYVWFISAVYSYVIYLSSQYQFGDMIEYPGKIYSHYAVYVGGETVKGKDNDQNIFEMISMTSCLSNLLQNLLKTAIPTIHSLS